MAIIVQKYGGSSVADVDRLRAVARQVVATHQAGHQVVVVISAMGDTTDSLLAQAQAISSNPTRRELDMLLTTGERISMSLLAMAIHDLGCEAISFTGSQSGIITNDSHTNARIVEVRPFRIQDELERGRIVIVAGYQGVSYRREITTLGRGGSDTTAVALAAALQAEACEIYSDVDGVYTADPRLVPAARRLPAISYAEMQAMAGAGARVLCSRAVEFARKAGIALYARKSGQAEGGTLIRLDVPPALHGVRGVAQQEALLSLSVTGLDATGLDTLFTLVEEWGLCPTGMSGPLACPAEPFRCQLPAEQVTDVATFRQELNQCLGASAELSAEEGSVTLVGEGVGSDPTLLRRLLRILADGAITPTALRTDPLGITLTLPREVVAPTVRLCHRTFLEPADS